MKKDFECGEFLQMSCVLNNFTMQPYQAHKNNPRPLDIQQALEKLPN